MDWFGRRNWIALCGTGLTVPVFLLLRFSNVDPAVAMLLLGVSYSVCAAALWPSVQFLVPERTVGTANGVTTAVQMLGIGICNIAVGALRDGPGFDVTMFFFVGLGVASMATVLLMFSLDGDRKMHTLSL